MLAAILKSKYVPKTTEPSHDAVITLFAVRVAGLCIITILHLFFYSVPTKVSEVRASGAVVDRVLHMEKCFSRMLTNMRQLSSKVDIKNVQFFLESILEADEFSTCKGFEDVLRLLRKSYIDGAQLRAQFIKRALCVLLSSKCTCTFNPSDYSTAMRLALKQCAKHLCRTWWGPCSSLHELQFYRMCVSTLHALVKFILSDLAEGWVCCTS